jgi:cytochrome oxidase assembly protein ShyY1
VIPVTRFVLQPRWLAWHLLLVVVLVSFTWLGRWQLGAFEDKAAQDVTTGDRRTAALDSLSTPGGRIAHADLGRRVTATGRYDAAGTRLVGGRHRPGGGGGGFWVVAQLRTAAGVQPVVRGWVPAVDSPAATPPSGDVTVTGLLQRSEDGPTGPAAGDVGPDQLPYVATVTVLDALPYPPGALYDGYLALRSEQPGPDAGARPVPVEAQSPESGGVGRWRNLAYALQWWLFAGAAAFFWWVVLRRAVQERREQDRAPAPPDDAGPPSLVAPRRTT